MQEDRSKKRSSKDNSINSDYNLRDFIIKNEGLKLKPYRCSSGKITIGVGRNIEDVGISEEEAMVLLDNDLKRVSCEFKKIFGYECKYSKEIVIVMKDMLFQLGLSRFKKFKKMIRGVKEKNIKKIIDNIIDSRYYNQVKSRADRNIALLRKNK